MAHSSTQYRELPYGGTAYSAAYGSDGVASMALSTMPSDGLESHSSGSPSPLLGTNGTANGAPKYDDHGRLLAPLHQATLLACTAAMANTILGAGMLGLPHALAESGFILGVVLLCLAGTAAAFALHLLSVSAQTVDVWPSSFYVVATRAVPSAAFLIDLAVAIKCFGVGTSYLIVIGDQVPEAIGSLIGHDHAGFLYDRRFWILVYAGGIVLPLSCLRSLNALRFTATISIGFVCFLTGVITLYAVVPSLDECAGMALDVCKGHTNLVQFNKGTLKILSIFIFGFTCHQNIFSACNELKEFTIPRINHVIRGSIGLAWCLYMLIGLMAYHTYGSLVKSDVLESYPSNKTLAIARLLIATNCSFTYPLQCNPCRNSIALLIHQWQQRGQVVPAGSTPKAFIPNETLLSVLTLVICLGSLGIAMVVSDLGVVLAVVGATGSTTISYILPGLIFLKLHGGEKWTVKHYAAATLLTIGCIVIPACLTFIFI